VFYDAGNYPLTENLRNLFEKEKKIGKKLKKMLTSDKMYFIFYKT